MALAQDLSVFDQVGEAEIGDPFLIERCLAGEVFVVRGFLQSIDAQNLVREIVMSALSSIRPDVAETISAESFDTLHELLSVEEFFELIRLTEQGLSNAERKLYGKVIKRGLVRQQSIWACRSPIFRVHVPFDFAAEEKQSIEAFRNKYGNGRITSLRPHRDSWFDEPLTCVTVWIALGTVMSGNGMSFFPGDYKNPMHYLKRQGVSRDQPVSRPVTVTMSEGDALFFHANHLHASEVNSTGFTRAAVTMRFAIDDPKLSMLKPWRYVLVNPDWPISLSWFLQSKRLLARILRRLLPGLLQADSPAGPYPRSNWSMGSEVDDPGDSSPSEAGQGGYVSTDNLVAGQPLAISERHLLIKIEGSGGQQVWRLDRRCPHEGADLALGHVEENCLRCPWHNLPIDIVTGASACQSMGIEAVRCEVRDGLIEIDGERVIRGDVDR